ncbi:hypothetical protein, partial [Glaesserella parasuis]|uniref:hypothetical protein n=1 Tax=Glaesserella parasuis TaxID=738 RepID=UPI00243675CD
LSDKLLKSKKERRTVKFNYFTTVRRCVVCIIEKFKTNASTFLKFFSKCFVFHQKLKTAKHNPLILNKIIFQQNSVYLSV